MELFYENSGRATFLVYTLQEGDEVDSIGLGMLGNNTIPGILPITENHHDEESRLLFNVTSQISLTKFLMSKISRKKILTVFISICDALLGAESYLLDENLFLLDKDYIFTNVSNGSTNLVYLPVIRETGPLDLPAFFKDLIVSIESDPDENFDYAGKILNFLNSRDGFDLAKFRELVYKLRQPVDSKKYKESNNVSPKSSDQYVQPAPQKKEQHERITPSRDQGPKKTEPTEMPGDKDLKAFEFDIPDDALDNIFGPSGEEEEKKPLLGGLFKKKSKEEKKPRFGKKKGKAADEEDPVFGFDIPGESPMPFDIPGEPARDGAGSGRKPVEKSASNEKKPEAKTPKGGGINDISAPKKPTVRKQVQDDIDVEGHTVYDIAGDSYDDSDLTALVSDGTVKQPKKGAAVNKRASLTRVSNNERKEITGDLFRMGRQKEAVDYVITGNKYISHVHADIIKRDGKYYISDLNSKNHTKVNGTELMSGTEYLLHSGDHILLSNEEFVFTE